LRFFQWCDRGESKVLKRTGIASKPLGRHCKTKSDKIDLDQITWTVLVERFLKRVPLHRADRKRLVYSRFVWPFLFSCPILETRLSPFLQIATWSHPTPFPLRSKGFNIQIVRNILTNLIVCNKWVLWFQGLQGMHLFESDFKFFKNSKVCWFVLSPLWSSILAQLFAAYQSFKALETRESGDDKQWLTYWVLELLKTTRWNFRTIVSPLLCCSW
jgi:magnesium-transporting ATPase (P-type)